MEMQTEAKMIREYTLLKGLTLSSVGNDMKQMEVPSIECVLMQLFLKSVSFKLNVRLLYDPTFPTCRKIFKENEIVSPQFAKDIQIDLFIKAPQQKQAKFPSTVVWLNTMNTYTMEYYTLAKRSTGILNKMYETHKNIK